jgi:transposase InsO family protein
MDYSYTKNLGILGYLHALNIERMEKNQLDKARKKAEIMEFFGKYGLEATVSAFRVSKITLYRWREKFKIGGIEGLVEASKTPLKRRERTVEAEIVEKILDLRTRHPRLGKEKIAVLLNGSISASTVGRVIGDLKRDKRIPDPKKFSFQAKTGRFFERKKIRHKKLRRRGFYPENPGDLLQVDTVVKFINGIRRYVVTAVDIPSGFSFAYAYKNHSSGSTEDFFEKLETVAPFKIRRIQTDNGSEFLNRFHDALNKRSIQHFYSYPRRPTQNAYIERFNRTIQEEFTDYRLKEMAYELHEFNRNLMEWLIWYNTERPHWKLNLISPIQYLIRNYGFSHMLWTSTSD